MSTVVYFDIKRFAVHDGPGIRTTLFLKGCPLRCWWCHNPESQSPDPFTVEVERKLNGRSVPAERTYGERAEVEELIEVLLKDRPYFEESGGGVTFSGGEPLMQPEGLFGLLEGSKQHGLHTTLDTSGFAPREVLERIEPYTDLFLYDLKNEDPELHRKYTGVNNALIRRNADFLLQKGASVIFRVPVIPGINSTEKEVDGMVRFLEERKDHLKEVHLLPYHRIADHKYLRMHMKNAMPDVPEPGEDFMQSIRSAFESTGLQVRIGG
ncbi:MAG: glycyl-radical enzyme activating protein [Bacteroidales bacterium]